MNVFFFGLNLTLKKEDFIFQLPNNVTEKEVESISIEIQQLDGLSPSFNRGDMVSIDDKNYLFYYLNGLGNQITPYFEDYLIVFKQLKSNQLFQYDENLNDIPLPKDKYFFRFITEDDITDYDYPYPDESVLFITGYNECDETMDESTISSRLEEVLEKLFGDTSFITENVYGINTFNVLEKNDVIRTLNSQNDYLFIENNNLED